MLQKEWQRKQKVSLHTAVYSSWLDATLHWEHCPFQTWHSKAGRAKSTAPFDAVSLDWRILFSGNNIYTLMNISLGVFAFSQPLCFITRVRRNLFFFWQIWSWITTRQQFFISIWSCSLQLACAVLWQRETFMVAQVPESSKVAFLFSVKGTAYLHSILALIKQSERN